MKNKEKKRKYNLFKAIREKCFECAGSPQGALDCYTTCSLHPFRTGHKPRRNDGVFRIWPDTEAKWDEKFG